MLSSDTKRRIVAARDILVGKLPLPTDQVELITLALIYKFMDDLDEQSVQLGGKRSFFVKDLEPYRWRSLLSQKISGADRVKTFADGLEALGDAKTAKHLPEMFRDVFRNAMLKFRDGQTLSLFLQEINGFTYSHSEELGNAFEYLLQTMGIQGENGQFRTPRHIIDFIVEIMEPKPEEKILDPACGTGGFLVSAYKHILAKHTSKGSSVPGDQLSPAKREKLTQNLSGYDITPMMVKLSKVNMFLHGFSDPQIHEYDTLSNDARWNEKADLIIANPPFMTPKGGVKPHKRFRISSKKAEVLFTDYISEHLSTNGRAGVIVAEGIVFQKQKAYKMLRKYLIEDSLVAAISLPDGVFNPYSLSKTTILILDKELARKTTKVVFFEVSNDGFDLGAQRRTIKENDLPEAKLEIRKFIEATNQGKAYVSSSNRVIIADRSTILGHKIHSLLADNYKEVAARKSEFPTESVENLIDIDYGTRITKKGHIGTKYPVYGGGGESFRTDSFTHHDTIVISRFAMSEECVRFVKGRFYLLDSGFTFEVKKELRDKILKEYLINYFLVNQDQIYKTARGIDQKNIDIDKFKSIRIPVPTKAAQIAILSKLNKINSDIEKNYKVISELNKAKHDLYEGVWED